MNPSRKYQNAIISRRVYVQKKSDNVTRTITNDLKPLRFNNSNSNKKVRASRTSVNKILSILILSFGLTAAVLSYHNNTKISAVGRSTESTPENKDRKTEAVQDTPEQITSDQTPSEVPIPAAKINNYQVEPDVPKYLKIPKIGLGKTRIAKLSIDTNNNLTNPANIWDAGWYKDSARPNSAGGTMFIAGHYSGYYSDGLLSKLNKIQPNDIIEVISGDNTTYRFKVVDKKTHQNQDLKLDEFMISKDPNKLGLTIMTCQGKYNEKTKTYDQRLAVYAVKVD